MEDRGLAVRGASSSSGGEAQAGRGLRGISSMLLMGAVAVAWVPAVWVALWMVLRGEGCVGALWTRWVVLGLAALVLPGAAVAVFPRLRTVYPRALRLLVGAGDPRAARLDEAVAGRLDGGERILASMRLDVGFGPAEWLWSQVVGFIVVVGAAGAALVVAGLTQVEPLYALIDPPVIVVSLVVLVWALAGLMTLDATTDQLLGGLPLVLAPLLWVMAPSGFAAAWIPLSALLLGHALWTLRRTLLRGRRSSLLLTSRGLRRVDEPWSGPPAVGPALRPSTMRVTGAPYGERWQWTAEGGSAGEFYPIMVSAATVARLAAGAGLPMTVRIEGEEPPRVEVGTLVAVALAALWFWLAIVPGLHLELSLAQDLPRPMTDPSVSLAAAVARCDAITRHHGLALMPRLLAAQGVVLGGDVGQALQRLSTVERLLSYLPPAARGSVPRGVTSRMERIGQDAVLAHRTTLSTPEGWEPEGEALLPYRRAMALLFGSFRGDEVQRFVLVRELLDVARRRSSSPAPTIMLAYLHARYWNEGREVDLSLPGLVEASALGTRRARAVLAPLAAAGPFTGAAASMGAVRGWLSERQVATGLLVEFIETGSLPSRELAVSLLHGATGGNVIGSTAFPTFAITPPSSDEEFLGAFPGGAPRLLAQDLWARAAGARPLDEKRWLEALLRRLSLGVPSRLAPRVRSEPGLAWLRPFLANSGGS